MNEGMSALADFFGLWVLGEGTVLWVCKKLIRLFVLFRLLDLQFVLVAAFDLCVSFEMQGGRF